MWRVPARRGRAAGGARAVGAWRGLAVGPAAGAGGAQGGAQGGARRAGGAGARGAGAGAAGARGAAASGAGARGAAASGGGGEQVMYPYGSEPWAQRTRQPAVVAYPVQAWRAEKATPMGSSTNAFVPPARSGAMSPWDSRFGLVKGPALRECEESRLAAYQTWRGGLESAGKKVEAYVGCVIERLPVVLPDLKDYEVEMLELQQVAEAKKKKQWNPQDFQVKQSDLVVRRDGLWAHELLEMGSEGRLGPKAIDPKLRADIERLSAQHPGALLDEGDAEANADLELVRENERRLEAEMAGEEEEEEVLDDAGQDAVSFDLSMDDTSATRLSAQDAGGFRPQPRVTKEDETNDVRSLRRRLQRRLYLVVKVADPSGGSQPVWRFPMAPRAKEDKLLDAARKAADGLVGEMDIYYISKIPCGYTWFELPPATGAEGAHVLFFRGQRLGGNVALPDDKKVLDYAWITNDELANYVEKPMEDPYWCYARMFLED
jgi:hypothetical protein